MLLPLSLNDRGIGGDAPSSGRLGALPPTRAGRHWLEEPGAQIGQLCSHFVHSSLSFRMHRNKDERFILFGPVVYYDSPRGGSLRAVITGGAGFLGSHLCDYLIEHGWDVLSIDNLVTGSEGNAAHLLKHSRFRMMRHDVSHYIDVPGPVDYVLHFASPASPVDYLKLPIQTLKVGALGTHNSLGLALAKKAKYFLASTSECYGDPQISPQPETYWGHVNPIGPRGVYDEAKRYAEAMVMAYHRYHGVDTHIVRIFNTYGPRMRLNDGRALPNFVYQALRGQPITVYGDGRQTRSFCYVSDLIEGIYRLMNSDEHEPVNIGNPQEITILEFAERVRALLGLDVPIVFRPLPQDDPKQRCPDISKAKRLLGWEPKVNLNEGLRLTLDFFRQQVAAQPAAI